MKKLSIIFIVSSLLLSGCVSKELSKEEALVLLKKDRNDATPVENGATQEQRIEKETIKEIKEIIPDYLDKTVVVVYTIEYKDLLDNNIKKNKQGIAHFTRTDQGWILDTKK